MYYHFTFLCTYRMYVGMAYFFTDKIFHILQSGLRSKVSCHSKKALTWDFPRSLNELWVVFVDILLECHSRVFCKDVYLLSHLSQILLSTVRQLVHDWNQNISSQTLIIWGRRGEEGCSESPQKKFNSRWSQTKKRIQMAWCYICIVINKAKGQEGKNSQISSLFVIFNWSSTIFPG